MASPSLVSQNKRGTDEYWNCELALPVAKRTSTGGLVHDSVIMALLEKIDNMDPINSNPEETHTNMLQNERLNGVMDEETGLNERADDDGEKGIGEMGSIKEGEITEVNSEATSDSDTADLHFEGNLTYYDYVSPEPGIFMDHTAVELGIIMNLLDGNSKGDIMFSDAVYGYTETVYTSLWEDDIWQQNEHPVIQNVFVSTQHEEFIFSGAEFHGIWNEFTRIQRQSATADEGGLQRRDSVESLPILQS